MTVARSLRNTALQRLKKTYGSDDVILPLLERHVMKTAGNDPDRNTHVLHPSDMSHKEWCHRHDYYRIIDTPIEKESKANPSFRMANIFEEGHTIHGKYQTWLWEMGVLHGWWRCYDCHHRWEALSPELCPACGRARIHYAEVPLRRSGSLIGGHSDGAVHNLDGYTGLIEIKSIGIGTLRFEAERLYNQYIDQNLTLDNLWWRINRPFATHMRQGQIYLWLAWPRYEQITFIYESKFNQAAKEFVVQYNPTVIAPLLEKARLVSHAVDTGKPPPRPDWAEDAASKICSSCVYRLTCWSLHDTTSNHPTSVPAPRARTRRAPAKRRARKAA